MASCVIPAVDLDLCILVLVSVSADLHQPGKYRPIYDISAWKTSQHACTEQGFVEAVADRFFLPRALAALPPRVFTPLVLQPPDSVGAKMAG